jgi:hypothetical protein
MISWMTVSQDFCDETSSSMGRARFCKKCGTRIATDSAPAKPAAAPTAPNIRVTPEQPDGSMALDGERKMVTALFADIKGSMDLMEDLDPEEARAIVDPAIRLMIDAAHRYDGYVEPGRSSLASVDGPTGPVFRMGCTSTSVGR